MKKITALLGTITTLALSGAAYAAAIPVPIGTKAVLNTDPYFYITSGTPTGRDIHATFGATPTGMTTGTSFDYLFTFHVAYDGTGSGALTTSFVGAPDITVSSVIINGKSYTPETIPGTGQRLNVGGVPLDAGALDTIEVIGTNDLIGGPFSGNVAFLASVPETATWISFLVGFGFMGLALRRKVSATLETA